MKGNSAAPRARATDAVAPALLGHGERLSPKLLLIDDHELIRYAVKCLCTELRGTPIQWLETCTLADALDIYAREESIDAVLLDLNLSDCKGLQGLRHFLERFPGARVAIFSATQDEFVIRQARALGATGYLSKGAGSSEMREAIASLIWPATPRQAREGFVQSPVFSRHASPQVYERVAELGSRHIEILELVLSGCTNQEISNSMHLSLGTVKNYVSALLLALDVRSRSHMVSLFR